MSSCLRRSAISRGVEPPISRALGSAPCSRRSSTTSSAPDIAGRRIANPCALLLAAAQMLTHLDMAERARRLREAIAAAIATGDGVTPDLGGDGTTDSFADAIIARL